MTFTPQQIIDLLIALAPVLVPLALALYQAIAAKIAPALKQHPTLLQLIQLTVQGVQQEFEGSTGAEKKQAAMNELSLILKHYNITIDPSIVSILIEAYVREMKQYDLAAPAFQNKVSSESAATVSNSNPVVVPLANNG